MCPPRLNRPACPVPGMPHTAVLHSAGLHARMGPFKRVAHGRLLVCRSSNSDVKVLEAAVQTINKMLNVHQKIQNMRRSQPAPQSGAAKPATQRNHKSKLVTLHAKASASKAVEEKSTAVTTDSDNDPIQLLHSLQAYLSLPLDQYSVLDPKLIARIPCEQQLQPHASISSTTTSKNDKSSTAVLTNGMNGTSGHSTNNTWEPASGCFLLKVPLREIVGIDLEPQLVIRVEVDDQKGQVGCGNTMMMSASALASCYGAIHTTAV